MKAITLLNHHEVRFSSLTEQLQMIREVPIVLTKNNLLSKCSIAMRQTLSILPGETIELKGEFKRSSIGHSFSVPIQDSFHIVTQSKQTGFPHPSQHHGWALSKALLPQEHLLTNNLQEMAGELMPEGCLNRQAKELLKIKKQCFESNVNSFLKLHRELIEALLKMAKLDSKWVVDQFFTKMINQNNIFQSLSQIHQQINSIYLESSGNLSSFTDSCEKSYMELMGTCYQEILKNNRNVLEELALKQLQDFIFELKVAKIASAQDMNEWMLEMFWSDMKVIQAAH